MARDLHWGQMRSLERLVPAYPHDFSILGPASQLLCSLAILLGWSSTSFLDVTAILQSLRTYTTIDCLL